jgi:DNA-binding phage protein
MPIKITKSQLEKIRQSVKIEERRLANGIIVKSYKGISEIAEELGIARVTVYRLLELCPI